MFSRTGGVNQVAMVGSANLATGNIGEMWNDLYTSVSDTGLYAELERLHVDRDGVKDYYVHHKYLLIGQPGIERWHTYTGSHN